MKKIWNHDAALKAAWSRGDRVKDIAAALGFAMATVSRRAKRLDLPPRTLFDRRKLVNAAPMPVPARPEPAAWPDGWSIALPTREQLMSGGRPFVRADRLTSW